MGVRACRNVTNDEIEAAYRNPDNRNIIDSILRRYSTSIPEDDLQSCGWVALWRALQNHDPSYGQKFTTSLYRFVNWECLHQLRKVKRDREKHVYTDDLTVFERPVDSNSRAEIVESIDLLPNARQRDILRWYYLEGETVEKLSLRLGCSNETARKKLLRAVANLRCIVLAEE